MNNQNSKNAPTKLNNVRLSFPDIWVAKVGDEPGAKPKFAATFILDNVKNAADIARIRAAIELAKKDPKLNGKKPTKVCLRKGDDTESRAEMDGYGPNVMTVSARSVTRPAIVDQNRNSLSAEDGKPYAGCYVNATIDVYAYTHPKSGPGIGASLRAIQFLKDGEPFGAKPADPENEFDVVQVEEEAVV